MYYVKTSFMVKVPFFLSDEKKNDEGKARTTPVNNENKSFIGNLNIPVITMPIH